MSIRDYQYKLDQFQTNRRNHPEESTRHVPSDFRQLPLGGINVINAAMMVIDIAKSKKAAEKLGNKRFTEWIGQALHLFFHCIDDYEGFVDKYTGDGAMVSFSKGTEENKCNIALECSLKISEILGKVLNPYYKANNFPEMNIRIGLDYGQIRVERIGRNEFPHLILIGGTANVTKEIEEYGENLEMKQNTTICVGYDCFFNIPQKNRKFSNGSNSFIQRTTLNYNRETRDANSYPIYEYIGRYYN